MVEKFIAESGETLDWMEKYSFEFAPTMAAFFHPAGWKVWTSYAGKNGGTKDDAYVQAMDAAGNLSAALTVSFAEDPVTVTLDKNNGSAECNTASIDTEE